MIEPYILEIKGNSLDDGPGIRTTVFFKGCPLNCIWCHNPESKLLTPELSYDASKCIGCGSCISSCPNKALSPTASGFVNRTVCQKCFTCIPNCPTKALTQVGMKLTQAQLLHKLLEDKLFYDLSGGGVTLTGGEATLYAEWLGLLAKQLKESGIHILLETCGYFDYEKVRNYLLPYLDIIFCDIKLYDRHLHKKYCGVYNDRILENISQLAADSTKYGFTLLPRIPLIPNITDTSENLINIANFLNSIGISKIDLLPYNPTWYSKADKIGASLSQELTMLTSWQSQDQLKHMKEIFLSRKIDC
ncbi:MAG: glycyl-radical enzyme activating protein [Lachnospiraceae bacterium]|nr:glycyl-radical enzyme activating protein [Lachnospiraceae bacterium]